MASLVRLTTLREFTEPWTLETMPACEEGMTLLKRFADIHPMAWRIALLHGSADMDRPELDGITEWNAFTRHCSSCEACNEV